MTSAEKKKVRRLLSCLKTGGKGSSLFHHETYDLAVREGLLVWHPIQMELPDGTVKPEKPGWEITAKGEALLNNE